MGGGRGVEVHDDWNLQAEEWDFVESDGPFCLLPGDGQTQSFSLKPSRRGALDRGTEQMEVPDQKSAARNSGSLMKNMCVGSICA